MPWHAQSLFTAGPRRPLTRDQRRIWLAQVELHRRARAITATHALVAAALLRRLGQDGRCDPAQDTIAHDAGCCPRTVSEALRRLRRVGLVDWLRRLVRTRAGVRQTSNAYRLSVGSLSVPIGSLSAAPRSARRTRDGTGLVKKEAPRLHSAAGNVSGPQLPARTVQEQIAAALAWAAEAGIPSSTGRADHGRR